MSCATACGDSRPSEAAAHAMVESMAGTSLLQPLAGSKVITTRRDFCGGGSVAPFIERRFSGKTAGVEDLYRQRMAKEGWQDIRDVPAGGVGATKDDRTVSVMLDQGGWSVFMQQGTQPAHCQSLDGRGEEVTNG